MNPIEYIRKWFSEQDGYQIKEDEIGESKSFVFFIEKNGEKRFVLKCNPSSGQKKLQIESDNLSWLQGRFKVPGIEWYKNENGWEWLLMSYLPGLPSFIYGKDKEVEVGKILGSTLKSIHQISLKEFPDQRNKSAIQLLEYQKKNQEDLSPYEWDPVISHGDYCLPNILIEPDATKGIIDLGDFGIFDRYHDIFWCIWSLKFNKLESGVESFLEAYGLKELDQNKIELIERINGMA